MAPTTYRINETNFYIEKLEVLKRLCELAFKIIEKSTENRPNAEN